MLKSDRDPWNVNQRAMVSTLIAGGGLYVDLDRRLFVPSTGYPHVCRIDLNKMDDEELKSVGHQYSVYIAKNLNLNENWLHRHRFKYLAADSPKARRLATAVRDHWAECGVYKELITVPEDCHNLRGRAVVVADASRTGLTLARSVERLTAAGADVSYIFTMFNFQFGMEETLNEALIPAGIPMPKLDYMLRRGENLFLKKGSIGINPEVGVLISRLFEYNTGPVRHSVKTLYKGFVEEKKAPERILVSTRSSGNEARDAQEALERAVLRLSIEAKVYSGEQHVWSKTDVEREKADIENKMAGLRHAYISKYHPHGLPWLEALPHILTETVEDATSRGYSLNGHDLKHMSNVRKFFRRLKKHQPGLPHNICGLPDWDVLSRIP